MSKALTRKDPLRSAAEARLASATAAPACSTEHLVEELRIHEIELEMQNEALRQARIAMEESRDRYLHLYDFAPVAFLTLSREGLIADANLAAAALIGLPQAQLHHHRFESFIDPVDHDHWRHHIAAAWQGEVGQTLQCELLLTRGDGSRFPAHLQYVVMKMARTTQAAHITFSDISERKRYEEEQRIAAIAFDSQEGMVVTDGNAVIIRVNRAFTTLTGYSQSEVVGKTPALLRSGRHDQAFYERMWQSLKEKRYWQGEIWNRRKTGKIYAEWLTISAVSAPDGSVSHYVGTFSDLTQESEAKAEIRRLAFVDPLTNLPNRRLLQDRLGRALAASVRNGLHGAILFLDLDNFKTLNDTRGHDVGDLLLVEVAKRLCENVRECDTVARLGGDEFVVLLEGLSAEAAEAAVVARRIADKLNDIIAQPFDLAGTEVLHTTSIGVGLFCGQETVEESLKHADLALYQAKAVGRNTVLFYDPAMQAAIDERSALETELRHALKREQFHLYYQAQVDSNHRIIGAETLLRWQHPERGVIAPGDFIPLAEESGLILAISEWVLETACTQLEAWSRDVNTQDLMLTVNVSGRQFRQPDFVDQIRSALENSSANPKRLKLELTERLVLEDVAQSVQKMHAIKQWGVQFSMDDFGTGFSSLSYLTLLPLNELKIDRSFVFKLPGHETYAAIVTTIILMARSLGLTVVAEGVENEAQRAFLDSRGCHAFQGYLFSRPVPLEEFEALVGQI